MGRGVSWQTQRKRDGRHVHDSTLCAQRQQKRRLGFYVFFARYLPASFHPSRSSYSYCILRRIRRFFVIVVYASPATAGVPCLAFGFPPPPHACRLLLRADLISVLQPKALFDRVAWCNASKYVQHRLVPLIGVCLCSNIGGVGLSVVSARFVCLFGQDARRDQRAHVR